jgi:hypothetical protein
MVRIAPVQAPLDRVLFFRSRRPDRSEESASAALFIGQISARAAAAFKG